jgi:hypothetical protein
MIFFEDLAKPQKGTGYRSKGNPYSKAVKAIRESGLRAFPSFRRCPWTKIQFSCKRVDNRSNFS